MAWSTIAVPRRYLTRIAWSIPFALLYCSAPDAERPPNVILVMSDDQGWGDVAYNGHPVLKTPHLDALADSGVRFDHFYAAAPVCSPTRGSVMTGRHPNRFGCFSWGHTLRPQEVTLAEVFQDHGYATGHFGKWHLGSVRTGSPVSPGASGFDEWLSAPNFFDNNPVLSAQGRAVEVPGESSMVTVDAALQFISGCVARDRAFLAVVWFGSPHDPHLADPVDRSVYPDQPEALQNYYGEITGLDRALGKLREGIRTLGIRDQTILWFCGDNGALPGIGSTGGRRGAKGDIYDGGLAVPAIFEWPGHVAAPRGVDVPAVTSDIFPTLLDLCGIQAPSGPPLDGVSLAPVLGERVRVRSRPIGFWQYPEAGIRTPSLVLMRELLEEQREGHESADPLKLNLDAGDIRKQLPEDVLPGHSAWLDGSWKLHRIAEKDGSGVRFELYDLASDPAESLDLCDQEPERVERLSRDLEDWQRSVIRSLNGDDYGNER